MDFDNLKNLKERDVISEESYIKRVVDFAKIYLEKDMKLEVLKIIERGRYGGIIMAKEKGSYINLAVKVVISEKCLGQDFEIWPSLKHPNIIRLLDMKYLLKADAYIFITEYYLYNLECHLQRNIIVKNHNAPAKVKRLLWDILEGLEYLHDRGYSHLDLKPKNILISREDRAIISNFRSLDTVNEIPKSTKVSLNYGPPEMHFLNDCNSALRGAHYDIWSFGILALNIFTDGYVQKKIPEDADWHDKVYPYLLKILQMRKFSKYVKKAFPASKINKASKKLKINFIITCLRILPAERPTSHMLLKHGYFLPDGGFMIVHKQPWNKKKRIKADSWRGMFNHPSPSPNMSTLKESFNESKTHFGKRNDKELIKENEINDNILEKNTRSMELSEDKVEKSFKDNIQKSASDIIQNNRNKQDNSQLTNAENKHKETRESVSQIEESTTSSTLNKSIRFVENHEVNQHNNSQIINTLNKGGETREPVLLIEEYTTGSTLNKSDNFVENREGNQHDNSQLTNTEKKSEETKESISQVKESTSDSALNKLNTIVENHEVNQQNDSQLTNTENTSEETRKSISLIEESTTGSALNKSINFVENHEVNTKNIDIVTNKEVTLDTCVTSFSQMKVDDTVENQNDQKSKLQSMPDDDVSIKTIMEFLQPTFFHVEGAPQKYSKWASYQRINRDILSSTKKQSCSVRQLTSFSESKMDSSENPVQEKHDDDSCLDIVTNFSSTITEARREDNENQTAVEDIRINQQCKEVDETDWRILHAIGCSTCSLSSFGSSFIGNKSLVTRDCDEDKYSSSSVKSELTKVNRSEMNFSENESNSLQDKQVLPLQLPTMQSSHSNASEQTDNNLIKKISISGKKTFLTGSPSSSRVTTEYLSQKQDMIGTSDSVLRTTAANVDFRPFDAREYGDVVSTNLKLQ